MRRWNEAGVVSEIQTALREYSGQSRECLPWGRDSKKIIYVSVSYVLTSKVYQLWLCKKYRIWGKMFIVLMSVVVSLATADLGWVLPHVWRLADWLLL